jgi:hypothetical protein
LVTGNESISIGWSRKFDDPISLPKGRQLVSVPSDVDLDVPLCLRLRVDLEGGSEVLIARS